MSLAYLIRLLGVIGSAISLLTRAMVIIDNVRYAWRAPHAKPA